MESKAFEFKSRMTNIALAEPITYKGKAALKALGTSITEAEFLSKNGAYVEPFSVRRHNTIEEYNEKIDPDARPYYLQVVSNNMVNEKATFESKLKEMDDSIFLVKGGTGCGKTTYVHHLQLEFTDIQFVFCDFEESKNAISLFGHSYDFGEKYDSNVWKFVSLLTEQINAQLVGGRSRTEHEDHALYIKEIVEIYKDFFENGEDDHIVVDEDDMRSIFFLLEQYSTGNCNFKELNNNLYDFFVSRYESFEKGQNREKAVYFICNLLFRLTLCRSRMPGGSKYAYVVDNIEYFVPFDDKHPIQECELSTIVDGLAASIRRIKAFIRSYQNKNGIDSYQTCYSVLLAMRDTTVSLTETIHFIDFIQDNEIKITSWYNFEDISKRKELVFREMLEGIKDNPYYVAYTNVIEDLSPFNWGMHSMVCKMFNHDYRRIGLDLIEAIASQPEKVIEQFNQDWNRAKNNPSLTAEKHMCRKYIFRILLDRVQGTKHLDHISVENRGVSARNHEKMTENEKSSYARKVANILYCYHLDRAQLGSREEFMTLPQLILAVLNPPYIGGPTKVQIEDLASILYEMNETRNQATRWNSLIMMKYDIERTYTKANLTTEMINEWQEYTENGGVITEQFRKYGAKITRSGAFFAKFVADFEYFACRFAENYPALFVKENLKKSDSKYGYQCLDLIHIVQASAFRCIDEVIERDKSFFESTGRGYGSAYDFDMMYREGSPYKWIYKNHVLDISNIPHPFRIINHQIGYLSHYVEYVRGLPEGELNNEDRHKIITGVQKIIEEYNNKYGSITRDIPDYAPHLLHT